MTRFVLTVSAGFGPAEARRFARVLADALASALAARGAGEVSLVTHGDEAAPRSVDLAVEGPPGIAGDLVGTHALVARSAARGRRDRKRWYVGVSSAEAGADEGVALDPADVVFEACRARGPGGQHVNRTASAVRARHVPSGLVVRVESERSQHRNRARAISLLADAIAREARARRAAGADERRARALAVERGNAIATWGLGEGGLVRIDAAGGDDAR